MFEDERTLLVCVAFEAGSICSSRKFRLLLLKPPLRVMAIAAIHRSFKHLMMKWSVELRLGFVVAGHAEEDFVLLKHMPWTEIACVRRKRPYWIQRGRAVALCHWRSS